MIGLGGAGGNAVNRMVEADVSHVEFIAANTDAQALRRNKAPVRIQLGERLTKTLREELPPNLFSRERASETVPVAVVGIAALAVMFMAQRRRSRPVDARSF